MGTYIIDKIGSLKRNKGEVSFSSTKFFGGRHMHVWSRMSHKAIFLFFVFVFFSSRVGAYNFTNPTHYSARPPSSASCI